MKYLLLSFLLFFFVSTFVSQIKADVYVAANGTDTNNTCTDQGWPCATLYNAIYACPTTIHILYNSKLNFDGNTGLAINQSCSIVGEGEGAVIDFQQTQNFFLQITVTDENVTLSKLTIMNGVVPAGDLITIAAPYPSNFSLNLEDVSFQNIQVYNINNSVLNFTNLQTVELQRLTFQNNNGINIRGNQAYSVTQTSTYLSQCTEAAVIYNNVEFLQIHSSKFENSHTGNRSPSLFVIQGGSLSWNDTTVSSIVAQGHAPVLLFNGMKSIDMRGGLIRNCSNNDIWDNYLSVYTADRLYVATTFESNIGGVNFVSVNHGLVNSTFLNNLGPNAAVINGGNFTWVTNFINPSQNPASPTNVILTVGTSPKYTAPPRNESIVYVVRQNGSHIYTKDTVLTALYAYSEQNLHPLYLTIDANIKANQGKTLVVDGDVVFVTMTDVQVQDIVCSGDSTVTFSNETRVNFFDCWAAKEAVTDNSCHYVDFCGHCTDGSSCTTPPPTPSPKPSPSPSEKPLTHRWYFIVPIVLGCLLVVVVFIYLVKRNSDKENYTQIN